MSDSRASFEEWAKGEELSIVHKRDGYSALSTDYAFAGWSARDSEVERLREDAERYRWLRRAMGTTDTEEQDKALDALNAACRNPETPSEFDAAIDAARALLSSQDKESA